MWIIDALIIIVIAALVYCVAFYKVLRPGKRALVMNVFINTGLALSVLLLICGTILIFFYYENKHACDAMRQDRSMPGTSCF